MIVETQHRASKLGTAGVPPEFLGALDNLEEFGDLKYVIQPPEAAYFYLPKICDSYSCLAGWDITPICDGSNGDIFYVYLRNLVESKFVYFALEHDEILEDFGSQFERLLAHLLIEFYEFSELSVTELSLLGERLGFRNAPQLFKALENADQHKLRATFESDRVWRDENLPLIISG